MTQPLAALLRAIDPILHEGVYVFAIASGNGALLVEPLATFLEEEGLTVIVEESCAEEAGLTPLFRSEWITLTVHSDLEAVGLTAAVSAALAEAGIACNVVAAARHDHLFVPHGSGNRALRVLSELQQSSRR